MRIENRAGLGTASVDSGAIGIRFQIVNTEGAEVKVLLADTINGKQFPLTFHCSFGNL